MTNLDVFSKENGQNLSLEGEFCLDTTKIDGLKVELTSQGLILSRTSIQKNGKSNQQVIPMSWIIGCHCTRKNGFDEKSSCGCRSSSTKTKNELNGENSAYLVIYAYIPKQGRKLEIWQERRMISLRFKKHNKFEENIKEADVWRRQLRFLINNYTQNVEYPIRAPDDSRSYLVLLNPKSGQSKAKEMFHKFLAPTLVEAEISYDLCITKKANFARNFVRIKDMHQWKAVIICGGDGLFYEVINGIFERPDWKDIVNTLPFGIVPCGSGNGIARSLVHLAEKPEQIDTRPAVSSSVALTNGSIRQMDLVRVETPNETLYSALSVGFGFIADVDINSESIRRLGHIRFTLWSLMNLVTLPSYRAKVSYLPIDQSKIVSQTKSKSDTTKKSSPTFSNKSRGARQDSFYSVSSQKSAYYSIAESSYQSTSEVGSDYDDPSNVNMYGPLSNLPSFSSALPKDWITQEGDFVMIHSTIQSHLSIDCFFAPESKLNDGIIWLMIIKNTISRKELTSFLLDMTYGTHIPKHDNPHVKFVQCTAFRFEPLSKLKTGIMNVDGETVEFGPIQGEIVPGILKVITPSTRY